MKTKKTRRIALVLTCATLVACVLAGTFAFFTDRADANATAQAGNIDLVFTDMSNFAEHKVDGQTNGYTDTKVWTDGKLIADGDVMNPGDNFDLGYKVANTGTKSIDVKQQIVLTSDVALTDNTEEYKIVFADGTTVTPVKGDDDLTLTYELPQITLNGTVEEDGDAADKEYDLYLAFDRLAKNKFMDSNVKVELDIQAKQHRNTTVDDWQAWGSYDASVEQINP